MLIGGEKVLVVLDASKDLKSIEIAQSLSGLTLYPSDELTLLGVLRQVTNPSKYITLSAIPRAHVNPCKSSHQNSNNNKKKEKKKVNT